MSIKQLSVSELSIGIMLIEKDFREVSQGLKDLKLIDFDKELKCRCSSVFQNQLMDCKKSINDGELKNKLSVIKENFKSCAVPMDIQENDCELSFVKDRAAEVHALLREKIVKLGSRIDACDGNLTKLCSLIDSHIECCAIKSQLAGMLSIDPAGMNQKELDQIYRESQELQQKYRQWSKPQDKFLRSHVLNCHGSDNEEFVQALSEMKSKCNQRKEEMQREKFLGDVEFVLDGLKDGRTSDLQQRFATFPAEVQWEIFTRAGIVKGELPSTPAVIFDSMKSAGKGIPQSLTKVVDTIESVRLTLLNQADVLFLCPETAFVACVEVLKGYSDHVAEKYSNDAHAIQKKLEESARFGLLKGLIKLNMKSGFSKEHISRLLEEAEGKGLDLRGARGVYFWVWFFAHQQDSSAGGPNFGVDNAHKDLDRLFLAIDEASVTPERLMQRYASATISSLGQLKAEIEKMKMHSLNAEQGEGIVLTILSAAVRGGIVLDKPNGVYHWVWAIASKTDSWAHGENWGCDNAHKNIDRLLEAIKRSS